MRRPPPSRLTLLAIATVAVGLSLGFGSAQGNRERVLRESATVAATGYGQGSLAAVVRSDTDRSGSVWARRSVVSTGVLLLASMAVSGVALQASRQARRAVAARPGRAPVVPLRSAVGLRAPPQALVLAPIA